jgi:RHS repeat-associated protein
VKRGDEVVAAYAYDTSGRRISKKAGGKTTHFLYDGSRLLAEFDEQKRVVRTWTSAASPLGSFGVREGDVSQYFVNDAAGSLLAMIGSSGEVTASYEYTPFGEPSFGKVRPALPAVIPGRFAGALFDADTGLYQFGARYYDPTLGRFLTPDPVMGILDVPASHNAYQYAYNNPLRYRDSSGATAEEIADWLSSRAGRFGGNAGSLFGYAGAQLGALPMRAWYTATGDAAALGRLNRSIDRFTEQVGGRTGSGIASFAASLATDPLRFGSGLGTASVDVEQGHYGSALWHAGGDALRALPLGAAARGVYRASAGTMSRPDRLFTAQQDADKILQSGRIWGQTEGSVYAGTQNNLLARMGVPAWLRNTRQARPNDTTFVFEGQAARLFQPHEVLGPLSLIKRLGGQHKAGFGDIRLLKWHRHANGEIIVTEAELLAGQHAGGKLWNLFGPAARLWGRRGFELGADATMGAIYYRKRLFDALATVDTNQAQLGDRFRRDRIVGSIACGETVSPPAIAKGARVPNVVGKPAADAKAEMAAAGYAPALTSGDPATSGAGQQPFAVQQQWPAPGTALAAGRPVVLKIFSKPETGSPETKQIAVPSLVGLKAAAARERLGSLKLGARFEASSQPAKSKDAEFTVADQQPPANEFVNVGDAVVVRVFPRYQEPAAEPVVENPPPKPASDKKVPNLVGLTVRQAMEQAEAAGLSIGSYEETSVATTSESSERVHTQIPAAGSPLPADNKVSLKFHGKYVASASPPAQPKSKPRKSQRDEMDGHYYQLVRTTRVYYATDGNKSRPGNRLDVVTEFEWNWAYIRPDYSIEDYYKSFSSPLDDPEYLEKQRKNYSAYLPTADELAGKSRFTPTAALAHSYLNSPAYRQNGIKLQVGFKREVEGEKISFVDSIGKVPLTVGPARTDRKVERGKGPVW